MKKSQGARMGLRALLSVSAPIFFGSLLLSGPSQGQVVAWEAPPAGDVGIEEIRYQGTGCPQGTVASQIAPDRTTFTLLFSQFGVDSSLRQGRPMRKACVLDLRVRVPQGWSFTVMGVQLRGYAALQPGVVGVSKILTGFLRRDLSLTGRHRMVGPFDDSFELFTESPIEGLEWSNCGRERTRGLKIRSALVVRPKDGFGDEDGDTDQPQRGSGFPVGTISVDSIDGSLKQEYRMLWKRCEGRRTR